MKVLEWKAKKLQGEVDEECDHKKRMTEDSEFYSWMVGRVRSKLRELHGEKEAEDKDGIDLSAPPMVPMDV